MQRKGLEMGGSTCGIPRVAGGVLGTIPDFPRAVGHLSPPK